MGEEAGIAPEGVLQAEQAGGELRAGVAAAGAGQPRLGLAPLRQAGVEVVGIVAAWPMAASSAPRAIVMLSLRSVGTEEPRGPHCEGAKRESNRWPAVEPNRTFGLNRGEISNANV